MLTDTMLVALNEHLNEELYSSYLYLSMAAYFEGRDLPGFAHWMKIQATEELFHVMRVYDYISERNGRVKLGAVAGPPTEWKSTTAAFANALEHEQSVSSRINKLVDLALLQSDHATNNFLQWFVAEQVEEESNVNAVLQKVRMVEQAPGGMFILDRELASRVQALADTAQ